MFLKLLCIILTMGGTACSLLANRQQRLETAHETALLYDRLDEHTRSLWKLRQEIASRCRPDQLRPALAEGAWAPIILEQRDPRPALAQVAWPDPDEPGQGG